MWAAAQCGVRVWLEVTECDSEGGQAPEDASEDEGADGEARLRRHAHQPGQPVAIHHCGARHVPRVNEDGGVEALAGLEDGEQRRVGQGEVVDVAADLHPHEAQRHAARQLLHGQLGALHGDGAQAEEALGLLRHHGVDVVVEEAREVERVLALGPVREHDGHSGQHLHRHVGGVAVPQARLRAVAVVLHLAEERVALVHARAAVAAVLQTHPVAVAVARGQVRQVLGQDVRVHVDAGIAAGRRDRRRVGGGGRRRDGDGHGGRSGCCHEGGRWRMYTSGWETRWTKEAHRGSDEARGG